MVWCSQRVRGWLYSAGCGVRWTECTATSTATRRRYFSPIRRGGARDVETRRSPGSGRVLEDLGQARRVGEQRAGPIWSTTASSPRRQWREIEARGAVTALLCGAAAAEARGRGGARPGGAWGARKRRRRWWRHGGTSGRGREVGDDVFAENPLPPLCFFFYFCFSPSVKTRRFSRI